MPRVVAVYPQMRLIEDNPASISYLDIFKNKCKNLDFEHDAPIFRYYEYLDYFQVSKFFILIMPKCVSLRVIGAVSPRVFFIFVYVIYICGIAFLL